MVAASPHPVTDVATANLGTIAPERGSESDLHLQRGAVLEWKFQDNLIRPFEQCVAIRRGHPESEGSGSLSCSRPPARQYDGHLLRPFGRYDRGRQKVTRQPPGPLSMRTAVGGAKWVPSTRVAVSA